MSKSKNKCKTYYITTPIYFSNAKPHIGTAYCSIGSDVMARYKKAQGYDVKFLTGNDEHGQKVEESAAKRGVTPQQHVDEMCMLFKEMAKAVDVDYNIYWRTTDPRHQKAVQKIFKKLYDQDDIYKGSYEGLYCVPCETFFTELQLSKGNCPDCNRPVTKMQEEAYLLRLSKYQDRLMAYIEANPEFIMPESRKNEMVNNFLKPGLKDLCVSRTSFKWGIPVDFDPGHVVYVWMDALSNYANALGFLSEDDSEYKKYWPADVHMMGKEIVRFHSLIWPIILMALGEPLPKQIFGHGWLTSEGQKMSKSVGNVVDPHLLVGRYGSDALRYFLMREFTWGSDGDFKNEALLNRLNSDLANDLGNLLSRTIGMIEKYFGGTLPEDLAETGKSEFDDDLEKMATSMPTKVEALMEKMNFSEALSEIWTVIRRANKYCDENAPWVLCKDENRQADLANVLYHLAETLRIISVVIEPVMPKTPAEIHSQLCIPELTRYSWKDAKIFGLLPKSLTINKGSVLFPRLDVAKELEALSKQPDDEIEELITIDDFSKVHLKVGEVLECEVIEGTKLLKSQIKVGNSVRQIVSGIAKHYDPKEMVGKKVIVVTNLKPVKLRGVLSEGMILCASIIEGKEDIPSLLTVENADKVIAGAEVR